MLIPRFPILNVASSKGEKTAAAVGFDVPCVAHHTGRYAICVFACAQMPMSEGLSDGRKNTKKVSIAIVWHSEERARRT